MADLNSPELRKPELFKLDERLEADTFAVASWPLCELRMMNDAQYPWLILIPRIEGATELYHLSDEQRSQLDKESMYLSQTLMQVFKGEKLNVAALGNVVSQLHIHHVVRFSTDAAWPAPVWGKLPPQAMSPEQISERMCQFEPLRQAF